MLVEEVLNLLVGDVDAELLKRVAAARGSVVFETEDVKQSDRQRFTTALNTSTCTVLIKSWLGVEFLKRAILKPRRKRGKNWAIRISEAY